MSEVNQAFLRAYIKNRASQATPHSALDEVASGARSHPSEKKPQAGPSQTLPSGQRIRMDRAHVPVAPIQPASAIQPGAPSSQPVPAPNTRGVWGPIGVERGMKSMESRSVPAVVTNGVTAVTPAAATPSGPIKKQSTPSASGSNAMPVAKQPAQFDQVIYVDGIGPHARPTLPTRASATTLADITRPIAFGAGQVTEQQEQTIDSQPSRASSFDRPNFDLPTANIRVDQPHLRNQPQPPIAVPSARARSVESAPVSAPQGYAAPGKSHLDAPKPLPHALVRPSLELPDSTQRGAQSPSILPLPVAFAPCWELDSFPWPEVVKHIEQSNRDAFRQIGKHLAIANRDGLKVMSVTSGERGVGRSTVSMHLARCAAAAGLHVALIDGDAFSPSLMDQLKLDVEHGWQDCLFENVPLQEAAIHSIEDRITLFPLTSVISAQQMHANLNRMAKLVKRVSMAFDLVFIDSNRLNLDQRDMMGVGQESVVDAAIVVVDTELSIKEKVDSAVSILQGMGLASIGLVENFQS
jgi:Mrp family chromosome partitioning ATPase